jgi:hypothetical protein
VFTPVLAKHSKNFSIEDSFAIDVDRIQRSFDALGLAYNAILLNRLSGSDSVSKADLMGSRGSMSPRTC